MGDKTLRETSKDITIQLGTRSTILERLSFAFKICSAGGALAIAFARLADWPPGVTYVAASVVFISAVFVLVADKGASKSLADARIAMDKALEQEAEAEASRRKFAAAEDAYNSELERLSHLQAARDLVRAILEGVALSAKQLNEISVIDLMLKQARRALFLAHGFDMNDFHTICVYQRREGEDGRAELVCKAHIRAIECDLTQARVWKEGVGVAGIALAQGDEVVVPDLTALELGSLYRIPEPKAEDGTRYRSIVAEPISLDNGGALWGVLIATSSRPGHFSVEDRSYVNVTQSLAGMISLAVKLVRSKTAKPG